MDRLTRLLGYSSIVLTTTGLLFKVQHWPNGGVLLLVGIFVLNFGFLPLYFFKKRGSI